MKAVVLLIFGSARVVPPIKWINRGPAIMLGVNDTAKPIGWIKEELVFLAVKNGRNFGFCHKFCQNPAIKFWFYGRNQ